MEKKRRRKCWRRMDSMKLLHEMHLMIVAHSVQLIHSLQMLKVHPLILFVIHWYYHSHRVTSDLNSMQQRLGRRRQLEPLELQREQIEEEGEGRWKLDEVQEKVREIHQQCLGE